MNPKVEYEKRPARWWRSQTLVWIKNKFMRVLWASVHSEHSTNLHFLIKFNIKFKLIILLVHINCTNIP